MMIERKEKREKKNKKKKREKAAFHDNDTKCRVALVLHRMCIYVYICMYMYVCCTEPL